MRTINAEKKRLIRYLRLGDLSKEIRKIPNISRTKARKTLCIGLACVGPNIYKINGFKNYEKFLGTF